MSEQWRAAVGFPGYEASDLGRVRSVTRVIQRSDGKTQTVPGQVMRQQLDSHGRPSVWMRCEGRRTFIRVHRLVLTAFVGACPDGLEGCHNDGDRTNNRLDNLRWDTRRENLLDAVRHGTHFHARKTHCPKNHPYSGDNLAYYMKNGSRRRRCRTCLRALEAAAEAVRRSKEARTTVNRPHDEEQM